MIKLNKEQLLDINGGFDITGTFLNAFSRAIDTILDLGRSFGSAIRRISSGHLC